MKFTINRDLLLEGLNKVAKVVSPKHSIPILQGILIEVTLDSLRLTGSDSTETVVHSIPVDDELLNVASEGKVVLPKNVLEICKKLNKNIDFTLDGVHANIKSGRSDFQIITLDADEYPKFPKINLNCPTVTFDGDELRNLIRKTAFSASTSETRPILTGVRIEVANGVCTLVSTDSHRLSHTEKNIHNSESSFNAVIPAKSLDNASKILHEKEVDMYLTEQQVLFRSGNTLYLSRLLEGTYPDVSRLIPSDCPSELTIERKSLYDGLELLKGLALTSENNNSGIVKLQINGAAHLSTHQSQRGTGKIEVPYSTYDGEEDFTISFNIKYLQEALKSIDEEHVQISFQGQLKPFIVQPKEQKQELQLILPVRTVS